MDKFFNQARCDQCGGTLEKGRIMSMYNTDCICMNCYHEEKKRSDYSEAVKADVEQIKAGNFNYKGIKE